MNALDALVQPHRVHRRAYTDPDIFAAEMSKVFGGAWVYLAHESQVPEPNDFITARMGLRPLIITRDADGGLHALFNRCAHRASTVCQSECGAARRFQCSYHGWTYSNRGELVNLPFAEGYPADFDRADHGLAQVPRLGTYRGLIFGTLNLDAPSLADWLGPAGPLIDEFVDRSPSGRIEVRNCQRMIYRGNWKLAWDNAGDGLHPTFAHRSFVLLNERQHGGARSLSQFKASPDDTGMYGADLGNGHMFVDQRPGLQQSFWETQRPVPGREWYADRLAEQYGDDTAEVLEMAPGSMINLSVFPNLLIKGNHLETVDPVSVGETRLHTWVAAAEGAPEEVNVLRMRIAEDFPSLGNPDDLEIFERCQEGLAIAEVEWVDMSKGLGHDAEEVTDDGVRRAPVTHEGPMRGYLRAWLDLMSADAKLTTAGPGEVSCRSGRMTSHDSGVGPLGLLVQEVVVPRCEGRAVEVRAGQVLRITALDGPQVADTSFLALDNPREGYHAGQTVALNMLAGTGTMRRITTLWSRPPYERPMLTVVADTVGVHFAWNGGRCSQGVYSVRDGIDSGHRTCQGNLEEAVEPWGVDPDLIPDVFNVFMYTDVVDEQRLVFRESPARAGDYIDLRAEIDVLAAVSACPSETSASNGGEPKRIGLEVWERK